MRSIALRRSTTLAKSITKKGRSTRRESWRRSRTRSMEVRRRTTSMAVRRRTRSMVARRKRRRRRKRRVIRRTKRRKRTRRRASTTVMVAAAATAIRSPKISSLICALCCFCEEQRRIRAWIGECLSVMCVCF